MRRWVWIIGVCLCCCRWAAAQVTFIFDPERAAYTLAATTAAGKLYNSIKEAKEQIVEDKAYFVRDLIIINALDEWLLMKQHEGANDGQLEQVISLYDQTKQMVEDMWTDYDRIFIQTKDSVRQRTESAFQMFKKVSDYKVGQIHRRYEKFVFDKNFRANKRERLDVLTDCYNEMRRERARVARMASILYALASNPWAYAKDREREKNQKKQAVKVFDFE